MLIVIIVWEIIYQFKEMFLTWNDWFMLFELFLICSIEEYGIKIEISWLNLL